MRTVAKVLQYGFYWPNMLKDAHELFQAYDHCERTGNLSIRYEMPLQTILEVKLFDVWGIHFMGPFPPSWGNVYIVVDYVSKWVKVVAIPTNNAKSVLKFLHKNIFTRFGIPCALISDEGSHFDSKLVANALNRLDEALWVYQTVFKTPLGMSPFKLVYGKPYHLLVELEHKTYWVIKKLNIDWSAVGTNHLLELNEMEEFRAQAYENAKLHKLFLRKLKSYWSGPFKIVHVYPHGDVEVKDDKTGSTIKAHYGPAISSIVEKHGWQILCLHLDDVLTKVVKEFYAHLTSPENAFIYVHGVLVLFDEDSINEQYGLPEGIDEHSEFVKAMTIEGLNPVLTDLCVEGMT
ncbi:uncharacterized protein [Gossypium hirsutum]|uniref:Integrase catalytic domain-containing protein n=1 Tax=Gossypium hirsutum TaxID=3635 RepID=A0A1U8IY80_GOSHI|nr:uncharacterized protein LOC107900123 [Gossypium hirsutum]